MSVTPMRALLVAAAATLCGCELVAGIENLSLTDSDAQSGSSSEGFEASLGSTSPDGTIAGMSDDATVPADASVQESSDANVTETTDSTTTVGEDAEAAPGNGGDALPVEDVVQNEAAADGGDASITLTLVDDMMAANGVPSPGWLDGVIPDNPIRGTWYVYDDGSDGGVLTPAPLSSAASIISTIDGGRGSATKAVEVTGNADFVQYGAGIGFNLNAPPPGPYDAGAYQGFAFWARALGDAGPTSVRFEVLDKNTTPPSSGGVCDGGACNGYYGFDLSLTTDWQEFTVYFYQLTRPLYAMPDGLPFDPSNVIGCQFQVSPGVAFDLWINDVYFIDN